MKQAEGEGTPEEGTRAAERPGPALPAGADARPGLSTLAVSLSTLSTVAYFIWSNGVHNHLRWLLEVARKLRP